MRRKLIEVFLRQVGLRVEFEQDRDRLNDELVVLANPIANVVDQAFFFHFELGIVAEKTRSFGFSDRCGAAGKGE